MRVCILQHEGLVAPGFIKDWVISRCHEMQIIRVDCGQEYPSIEDFEMLIILGGQAGGVRRTEIYLVKPREKMDSQCGGQWKTDLRNMFRSSTTC